MEPVRDVVRDRDGFRITGAQPCLRLRSDRAVLPGGWLWIDRAPEQAPPFLLVVEIPGGEATPLFVATVPALLHAPRAAAAWYLWPQARNGVLPADPLEMREVSRWSVLRELAGPYLARLARDPGLVGHFARRAVAVLMRHGWHGLHQTLAARVPHSFEPDYADWVRRHDTLSAADERAIGAHIAELRFAPTFALFAILEDCAPATVARLIASLRGQLYRRWELVLVPVGPLAPGCRDLIDREREADRRVRVLPAEPNHAQAFAAALAATEAAFAARVEATAALAPQALYLLAVENQADPGVMMLYGDEDAIDDHGRRSWPRFKPRWNPELLQSVPYIGSFVVYRTDLLRRTGGWRSEPGAGADWDLALRVSAAADDRVRHLPFILSHRQADGASRPSLSAAATRTVLQAHVARAGLAADVCERREGGWRIRYRLPAPAPLVSIIVLTRNGFSLLRPLVQGLQRGSDDVPRELLIVDNGSDDAATLDYLASLARDGLARILRYPHPFNFSAMNNLAAAEARGAVLALLNDDIEVIDDGGWLREMTALALRPEVGAVGAKLCYPDGTIQHAGMVLGLGGVAGHAHRGLRDAPAGAHAETSHVREVAAVSAACLVLRADLYRAAGGLDAAHLPVAFNDVDLCLKLRRLGHRILWTPYAQLTHHESATRGHDHDAARVRRFRREEKVLLRRWGAAVRADPFCNPNLALTDPLLPPARRPRVEKPWRRRNRARRW